MALSSDAPAGFPLPRRYHWDSASPWTNPRQRFFEGWYFKVSLPQHCIVHQTQEAPALDGQLGGDGGLAGESVAWMYAIEDPAGEGGPQPLFPGVAAQVMGPRNTLLLRKTADTARFWACESLASTGGCLSCASSRPFHQPWW